jgi:hypothetical protein
VGPAGDDEAHPVQDPTSVDVDDDVLEQQHGGSSAGAGVSRVSLPTVLVQAFSPVSWGFPPRDSPAAAG